MQAIAIKQLISLEFSIYHALISFNFAALIDKLKLSRITAVEECDATKVEKNYFSWLHKIKTLEC